MTSRPNLFSCVLAVLAVAATAPAATIHVPGDQPTIQAAIDAAANLDVVIVAEGEYLENIDFLGKAITVRSTNPADPDVVANTIIDGGGAGPVVSCDSGEGPSTLLSGFVITGGSGTPHGEGIGAAGGGMRNIGSSPTVTHCSFIGNVADPGGSVGLGGGMYNSESSPTVIDCLFSGNTAFNSGGGMHSGLNCSPTVTNCTFSGNTVSGGGGGMTVANFSAGTVTGCTFEGNTANSGGAMWIFATSSPTVADTVFCDNTPDALAGDPFIDGGGNSFVCPCPEDLDGSGAVGFGDVLAIIAAWGSAGGPEDLNGNGTVDFGDVLQVIGAWGACP
jgi:parallel beta-helix repeat protein/predicted outer membrane repeat protein